MATHSDPPPTGPADDDSGRPISAPVGAVGAADRPPKQRPASDLPPTDRLEGADEAAEVARLRAEVSVLHAQLDSRRRRGSVTAGIRRFSAAVLIALTAFGLVASVVGVWGATTALNTNRWVATVAPLPQNPQVAAAVADYATTQVFQAIDVEQRLRTVLPPQAAFVAVPVAGQIRNTVRTKVTEVLQSDRFQRIWVELNRRAHTRALAILNGESDVVVARDNRVDIDLLPLINQVLRELSAELPTLFGKQISLPDLSSGAIPANLRARVEDALGVSLPANFAQFTVYSSGQLWAAQQAVVTAKRDLAIFVVGTFVLLLLALAISTGRRRTLLQLGLWLVVAAVAITAVLRAVRTQLLLEVPAGVYRDGVAAALTSVFSLLRTRGVQIIWIGAVLAAVMYLVGPGQGSTWLRRQLAAAARVTSQGVRAGARTLRTNGPGWTAAHLDLMRVGGVVVAAVLALILTSWTSLLVIAMLLAAYEVLITLAARHAAPLAPPPDTPPVQGPDLAVPESVG